MIVFIAARYIEREALEDFLAGTFPGEFPSVTASVASLEPNYELTLSQYTRGNFKCSIPRKLDAVSTNDLITSPSHTLDSICHAPKFGRLHALSNE